jgi:hypothetical protein
LGWLIEKILLGCDMCERGGAPLDALNNDRKYYNNIKDRIDW